MIDNVFDITYYFNITTGEFFRDGNKGYVKIIPTKGSKTETPVIRLKMNGNIVRYKYALLVCMVRESIAKGTKFTILTLGNGYLNSRVPIFKDGDINNMNVHNLLYKEPYYQNYYKYKDVFDTYIKNRVCIIDPSYAHDACIADKLIPVVSLTGGDELFIGKVENGRYTIDSTGQVYDNKKDKVLNTHIGILGYTTVALSANNTTIVINVIRLLAMAFLGLDHKANIVTGFKRTDTPRSNVDLNNISCMTRSELSSNYHDQHPEHADTYLKDRVITNTVPLYVNGIEFKSIRDASEYIVNNEKELACKPRRTSSVSRLIGLRLNGKRKLNRPMYGRYIITKKEIK